MVSDQHSSSDSNTADAYFRHYLNRTIMLLGEEAVQTLRKKTVAVAGCGGQGGAACLTLARMGVGNFILADPKPFDEPDINRQWGANLSTLGRNKADVYAEMLLTINPQIGIKKFCDGITDSNVEKFLEGADLLVDCLDVSVPGALRKRVFAGASARGMHVFTAAMLGFGGMVAGAFPGGLPLELLGGIEDSAIAGSKLPDGLREIFVPEFMDLIESHLHLHRVPSVAVSPALLGTILSVESAVALLGNTIAGWRPPICLPRLILVDLLRMNFRVLHLDELMLKKQAPRGEAASVTKAFQANGLATYSVAERTSLLASVGNNTNLLPHKAIDIDLLTDSWSEISDVAIPSPQVDATWSEASLDQAIQGLYGYKYVVPVFRGRLAEAILCRALVVPNSIALTNALFPTTRFHLENNGVSVQDFVPGQAYAPDEAFKGNIDTVWLQEALAAGGSISAVYIELCNNALGGHPVSMANLARVHQLASERGIPVILDAVRAFENAVLIRQREAGFGDRSLVSIVREICSHSDACASSLTKDFHCARGGFVAMNSDALCTGVFDLTLAYGDGLDRDSRRNLLRALAVSPESDAGPLGRTEQVSRLWTLLRRRSVPVTSPAGGHAVFVDARAMLPHIPEEQFPAQVLANELYVAGGIRAASNFTTPEQKKRGIHLLRLAIPIGYCQDEALDRVATAFEVVMANRERVKGLVKAGGPPGVAGEFAAEYRAIEST